MESILARSFLILFLLPVAGRCQEIVGAGTTPVGNFDVLAKSYDPNGFPMNPFWRWQSIADNEHLAPDPSILCASGLPDGADCTTQKTWENLPHIPKIFICMWQLQSRLIGHINWTPATYDGGILWKEKTPDEDCNFATKPINNNGLTRGSMTSEFGYLGLEFDSRETVQRMHSEPWATLWSQVSTGKSSDQVNNWLATHLSNAQWPYMVVTGLFGVDCEHDCHTE